MKKLLVALSLLLSSISAQAQVAKSTIVSDINGLFADNTAGAITAGDLRYVTTEIVSSYVDWLSCTTSGGMIYYTVGTPTCLLAGTQGQYLRGGTIPSWQSLASGLTAGTGIGISGTITPTVSVSDYVLNGLQSLASTGFVALSATGTPDTFVSRTLSASTGIGITNPSGIAGNPSISLNNQIAAGGPIGSTTTVPSITYNAQGQLTAVSSNTISASTLLDVLGSAQGDIIYRGGSGWAVLTPATSGQVLAPGGASANPSWVTVAGTGTVTSITCNGGLTGGAITTSGTCAVDIATNANFEAGTASKILDAAGVFTPETTTTYGTTTAFDFNTFINTKVTLTGNITTMNCSNMKAGQAGTISYVQDSTGSRTAAFNTGTCSTTLKFSGATFPTLTTSASAIDILSYSCRSSTYCAAGLSKGYNP